MVLGLAPTSPQRAEAYSAFLDQGCVRGPKRFRGIEKDWSVVGFSVSDAFPMISFWRAWCSNDGLGKLS